MVSTWNEIRSGLGGMAKKINKRADHLSSVAALRIKIAATKADLEAEYTELGRLVFAQSHAADTQDEDSENVVMQERISACMSRITALDESIEALTSKLEQLA
jgi:ubiquinone biosynthesis protein UbiJ